MISEIPCFQSANNAMQYNFNQRMQAFQAAIKQINESFELRRRDDIQQATTKCIIH